MAFFCKNKKNPVMDIYYVYIFVKILIEKESGILFKNREILSVYKEDLEMDESTFIKFNLVRDLPESIAFVNDKNRNMEYPALSKEERSSMGTLLLKYYRESKIISISYREKGRIQSCTGIIDRIDLIYKQLFLLPKKKISFSDIVGIKQ